ncbi:trans-1,2-dihydrobenzene-1,2-diol dehydrogenase-like [Onthophagus taurus]|uniref:trans-1,2-dihydrobenzene-1,2-diol dehydrogenase-like n=1 Tax=Onthophagus taurus TaxID=166361 RepID=UPI000C206550|nr:trans-1,2-dihydrobenzene-1,2-diol dehydrogenase-like [Onthophagus taurus]
MALRWGIASAGRISHDFVAALKTLPADEHEVVAVAARNHENSLEFAKTHGIQKAYEGYLDLATDVSVDVVYIGTINTQHLYLTKLMLEHGKHVLCEKPLTINSTQTKELIEYAKSKNLFLMEAIWSRCFPVYKELTHQLKMGTIGDVLYVNVTFGVPIDKVPRVSLKKMGGGGILDIGIYTLQFVQYIYRGVKPLKVCATGHLNSQEVDEMANGLLLYPDGKSAVVSCCTKTLYPNEAVVVGTKGQIVIPTFWCPSKLITPEKTFEYEIPKPGVQLNFQNSGGLAYEADEVRRCIKAGLIESPMLPHSESIELSEMMDSFRNDLGVIYPEDI